MSQRQQHQKEVMDHEETMQLHQAGLRQAGQDPGDRARLLDTVIESELETDDEALENLRAKDFPLSNFDEEADTIEYKWMSEILDLFVTAEMPHQDSGLQGLARAWASGDPTERTESRDLGGVAKSESYKLGVYSRAKRGEDMAQQETSAKQVTETHAVREDNGRSSGGGGLLGRWRS